MAEGQTAADPVADFLAREQGQLAELGDNFGNSINVDHILVT